MFTKKSCRRRTVLQGLSIVGILIVTFVLTGNAQTTDEKMADAVTAQKDAQVTVSKSSPIILPQMKSYKDVKIGSTADEVRDILGKAKIDDKDGFYYRFGDSEFAQIRLDKNNLVQLISITYSGDNKNTPTYADVFGAEAVTAAAKPDGSVYRLVRYPQAGYWVAYSRTAGNDPSVTVTIQKIRSLK